jgi:hypothetical protein
MFGNKENKSHCSWVPQIMYLKCMENESISYLLLLRLHYVTLFSEQCSIPSQSHGSHEQCFFKKSMQLIDFTRTVHMNVNNNFYFFKKNSLRWIKFIHTIISFLFLIIFYLILLHAQKIMETVVFVGWILYVIEL